MYNGVHYDDKLMFYLAGTEDRKRMILDEINLPGALLNKINYEDIRSEIPAISEEIELDLPRYGTLTGARMLVSVVPLGRQRDIPKKVFERKSEVVIKRSTVLTDTILVRIPEGYDVEAVPRSIPIESEFGSYSLTTSVPQPGMVRCIRNLELKKGKHPPASYNNLIEFYRKIAAADNSKVSLKRIP